MIEKCYNYIINKNKLNFQEETKMKVCTTLKETVKKIKDNWHNPQIAMDLVFKSFKVYGENETKEEMVKQGLLK